MSLVNVVLEQDRALIGVDTAASFMDGHDGAFSEDERRDRHACKIALFPQIGSAMTQRGDGLLAALARMQLDVGCPRTFDHAVQLMPEILAVAQVQATTIRRQAHGIETFPGAEIILVGRSLANLRFEAVRWRCYPGDMGFKETRETTMLILPEIDRLEPVDVPDTDEKMEALVRRQVHWATREHPQFRCGGRLLMTELTRDAALVRTIADLEKLPCPNGGPDSGGICAAGRFGPMNKAEAGL